MALSRARAAREEADKFSKVEKALSLKILKPGDAGYLADGTMFDNTYNRSQPVFFILGAHQVIQAFEDVVPILSRGEKARIIASPDVAYGEKGYPPIIPANATLTFEIELMTFSSQGSAERLHREQKLRS